jgi:hypothetical protein
MAHRRCILFRLTQIACADARRIMKSALNTNEDTLLAMSHGGNSENVFLTLLATWPAVLALCFFFLFFYSGVRAVFDL